MLLSASKGNILLKTSVRAAFNCLAPEHIVHIHHLQQVKRGTRGSFFMAGKESESIHLLIIFLSLSLSLLLVKDSETETK